MQSELMSRQQLADGLGRGQIREQRGDLSDRSHTYHRAAAELRMVGHQEYLTGISQDCLRCAHLLVVVVQERAVRIDSADANDSVVDPELADHVARRLTDDAAISI